MALSEMVRSLGLRNNAIYADHEGKKLNFAINTKDPEEDDHRMGQKIMEVVMHDEGVENITVPLKNHVLEETLTSMSITGKIAFTVNEVMQIVGKYFKDEKSLVESLNYLKQSNRIFYFSELFPDKVFGEPQAVLIMVTEVVMEHIQLTSGVDNGRVIDGAWKKFKEQAVITENILMKISGGFGSHSTPLDMLKLLEELLIVLKRILGVGGGGGGRVGVPNAMLAVCRNIQECVCQPDCRPHATHPYDVAPPKEHSKNRHLL